MTVYSLDDHQRLYDDAEGAVRMSPKEYLDSLGLMVAGSDADEETT